MKPLLVILAAGASERLGQCKALVDLGGQTPLERLARAGIGCDGAVVVTGADHAAIAKRVPAKMRVVENRDWEAGRTGSVAAGAREAPGRDLLVAPVDTPLVPREVFEALLATWSQAGAPARGWLAPAVVIAGRKRHGHPVVIGRELLLDLPAPGTPLSQLRGRAQPLLSVVVASERVLDDMDSPSDLARLRGLLGE